MNKAIIERIEFYQGELDEARQLLEHIEELLDIISGTKISNEIIISTDRKLYDVYNLLTYIKCVINNISNNKLKKDIQKVLDNY